MDLIIQTNLLKLIQRILDLSVKTQPLVPYRIQKIPFSQVSPTYFERVSPEFLGIHRNYIDDCVNQIMKNRNLDLHNILILRDGKVIYEDSFKGYSTKYWHITHSMCKSITAMAIGLMIDEGKISLDTQITSVFEKRLNPIHLITHKNITIRYLLTMSSGVNFNETGAITETDWVKAYFESGFKFEPGKKFNYNSMNTYILSAVIKEITGQNLTEYLRERLFEPLSIKNFYWETCPLGIEKGGWGLYLCPEDMAKLGQLFLQNGIWDNKQIIPVNWIRKSITARYRTPKKSGDYNYGYHIWVARNKKSYLFSGMFGQNVFVYPTGKFVIVTNCANGEMFQRSPLYDIIDEYFGVELPFEQISEINYNNKKLHTEDNALPEQCLSLDGKKFEIAECSALMPLITQALQNNYSDGINKISFDIIDNNFYITMTQGEKKSRFEVGFWEYKYTDIDVNGEIYKIAVKAVFKTNEDDIPVLKITVSFVETSSVRIIKFFMYNNDSVLVRFSEIPGKDFVLNTMEALSSEFSGNSLWNNIISKFDCNLDYKYMKYKVERALEPSHFIDTAESN